MNTKPSIFDSLEQHKISTSIEIPISYIHLNRDLNKPLLVFFHGFADSAKNFLRRAYPDLNKKYEILAINAPFPVPQKVGGEWKPAFAWYFADFMSSSIYIHPDVAVQVVQELLQKLDLIDRKKIVIAFSQGGFFAPHALKKMHSVLELICIGSAYRVESYPETLAIPLVALHGTQDEVISYEKAFESFHKLNNPKGEFVKFEGMGHTLNNEARAWLSQRIDKAFYEP